MTPSLEPERAPSSSARIRARPEAYPPRPPVAVAQSAIEGALGVRPEEVRRTALLTLYLFFASSVFVLGRTLRDALFLSHYGARVGSLLPFMFIAYGGVSSLVAVIYARESRRVRRDHFVIAFAVGAAAVFLAARIAVARDASWIYAALYVVTEIIGNLMIAQFWSVANELHDARSARRLFGLIGIGRIAGLVLCGLGTGSVVTWLGADNLLVVLAGLCMCTAFVAWYVARVEGLGLVTRTSTTGDASGSLANALRAPYVRAIGLTILLAFVAVNIGDFQFKAAARIVYPTRDALAHFMAYFYAGLGAIALVMQLGGTRWILSRFGVAGGILTLPTMYLAANVVLLLAPGLHAATLVKLSDNVFQYTIWEATLQLLYFPLAAGSRDATRSLLEAAAKPLGYALAGATVLVMQVWIHPVTMHAIASESCVAIVVVCGWIATIPAVRDRYLVALERSLTRRDQDAPLAVADDPRTRSVLVAAIDGDAPRAAVYALGQLASLDPGGARATLPRALANANPSVRIAALEVTAALHVDALSETVRALVRDPDAQVAAVAVETFGELAGEDCVASLTASVNDPRPEVRDAALVALLRRGGLDGTLVAGRTVEAWVTSSDPADRVRAATLFATPGIPGLSRIVRRLLADPSPDVRRAAIAAVGAVGDRASAPEVLRAMRDVHSRDAAARTLAQLGDAAVDLVAAALADAATPHEVRLALPRTLAQIGSRVAYGALLTSIADPDEWVRQKVLASASRTRAAGHFEPIPLREAERRMLDEIRGVATLRAGYEAVRTTLALPLLDRWMVERLRKGLVRVLRLAEIAHPREQVTAARDALFVADAHRRARALELLDNVLGLEPRRRFARELDAWVALRDAPLARSAVAVDAYAFVARLLNSSETFARVIGLDAAQFRSIPVDAALVVQLTADEHPAVREMAALVIATLRPAGWRDVLNGLRGDDDLRVRTYAEYAFVTGRTGMEPWDEMYTTLEKVLFLQRIPLFADVPAEHLLSLARSASVERRASGETVFRRGEPGDGLYFVIEGRVRVIRDAVAPIELGENEVFGEMSVLDASPRSDSVEVLADTTLLRIGQEDFYEVLYGTAELAQGVIHVLVRRLRAATAGPGESTPAQ